MLSANLIARVPHETFLPIAVARLSNVFLAIAPMAQTVASDEPEPRPNILIIMADDHAKRAISAYGRDLMDTPNIDRIANEGALFENSFVTNSICSPSRAVLLTGKFSHFNSVRDNGQAFDGTQQTFHKLLGDAGYQTSVIGKWHLKSEPVGFDEWQVLIGQGNITARSF